MTNVRLAPMSTIAAARTGAGASSSDSSASAVSIGGASVASAAASTVTYRGFTPTASRPSSMRCTRSRGAIAANTLAGGPLSSTW